MQQTQVGRIELNGTHFTYEVAGAGYPLVMLHAGIADRRMWDAQFAAFAQHYRVIRYDLRGFGQTPMVAGPFSHHQDLYALLVSLGVESAHLLGCSLGGRTIIDFALGHPSMASALIPIASGLSGYTFTSDAHAKWEEIETAYQAGDLDRVVELELQMWVDGPYRTPEQVDPGIRALVREMNLIALATPDGLGQEQRLEPAAINRLGELRIPTLVVLGALDDPNIGAIGDLLVEGIAGAQKVVISDAAHLPNMEHPAKFNSIVLEFLRGL